MKKSIKQVCIQALIEIQKRNSKEKSKNHNLEIGLNHDYQRINKTMKNHQHNCIESLLNKNKIGYITHMQEWKWKHTKEKMGEKKDGTKGPTSLSPKKVS